MGFFKNPLKVHKKIAKATIPKPGSDPLNVLGSGSKKPGVTTKPMQVSTAAVRAPGRAVAVERVTAAGPGRGRPPIPMAEGGRVKKKAHCKK